MTCAHVVTIVPCLFFKRRENLGDDGNGEGSLYLYCTGTVLVLGWANNYLWYLAAWSIVLVLISAWSWFQSMVLIPEY